MSVSLVEQVSALTTADVCIESENKGPGGE